jgi:DNA-directed RNA polymerase II subunit RPB9
MDGADGGGGDGVAATQQQPQQPQRPAARGLRFCPESNDLLYPVENKETRRLEYHCKACGHREDAPVEDWCVHVSETKHSAAERTTVLDDVRHDPTLPRTRDARCPACAHSEAVFFSAASEQGMTLYFVCVQCSHRWRDYV